MYEPSSYLEDWTLGQFKVLEEATIVARHRFNETGLFDDDALADLIDRHPDNALTIAAMGEDAGKFSWMEGDRNGLTGRQILEIVKTGKIWVNVLRVAREHREYGKLLNGAYDELEANAPGFKAQGRSANLLISSPNAIVFYHVDLPCNVLWHLRGEKQVWVYPRDERFVAQTTMERLAAQEIAEEVPYDLSYDDYALTFKVTPGQVITWAQNSPHRVSNLDSMNVSLSSDHRNPRSKRRVRIHQANHYLRKALKLEHLSTDPESIRGYLKEAGVLSLRLANRVFRGKDLSSFAYRRKFYLDPDVEGGIRLYDGVDANIDFETETSRASAEADASQPEIAHR